jgi:hypothetical protein
MIALPAYSKFSAIAFPIRPWATSYAVLVLLLRQNDIGRSVGPTSFALIWLCSQASISSPWKCTWRGLATYYVLFFLHLETRRVTLAGITRHPTEDWMVQMARRAVDPIDGALLPIRFVLHDRDTKFCAAFLDTVHPVNSDLVDNGRLGRKAFALSDVGFVCTVYLPGWLVS